MVGFFFFFFFFLLFLQLQFVLSLIRSQAKEISNQENTDWAADIEQRVRKAKERKSRNNGTAGKCLFCGLSLALFVPDKPVSPA